MITGVLNRYIAWRMTTTVLMVIAGVCLIAFLGEYIELLRRYGDEDGFSGLIGFEIAFMRLPYKIDRILPFAFLFASLIGLIGLSRRLELVVARASGVSAWQFLVPAFLVAIAFGLFGTFVLNPVAIDLKSRSDVIRADFRNKLEDSSVWFQQGGAERQSIVYAADSDIDRMILYGVTAFVYDNNASFAEKITALRAEFSDGGWILHDAAIVSADAARRFVQTYELPTDLTRDELRLTIAQPETFTVWTLPDFIEAARRTGRNVNKFRLTYHVLLSKPLFLMAMVMIAATVSLRLTRYGGTLKFVLTGVAGGFLLYVATEIVNDLGGNGIIDPIVAAWLPSIVALTFGGTALLYLEDG